MSDLLLKYIDSHTEEDLIEALKIFDKDGFGIIPISKFKSALKNILGEQLSEEEAIELAEEANFDGDGCIPYIEYVKYKMKK